ncbi:hypothetical protein HDE_14004 [Halotydeus destructor]|nr:hypothetical protein HDE_14004 [Halotydeus destructor]
MSSSAILLCVKNENYESRMRQHMVEYQKKPSKTVVLMPKTLLKDRNISHHKLPSGLLCQYSDYFRTAIQNAEQVTDAADAVIVLMVWCANQTNLKHIVDFITLGEIKLSQSELNALGPVARYLEMPDLARLCPSPRTRKKNSELDADNEEAEIEILEPQAVKSSRTKSRHQVQLKVKRRKPNDSSSSSSSPSDEESIKQIHTAKSKSGADPKSRTLVLQPVVKNAKVTSKPASSSSGSSESEVEPEQVKTPTKESEAPKRRSSNMSSLSNSTISSSKYVEIPFDSPRQSASRTNPATPTASSSVSSNFAADVIRRATERLREVPSHIKFTSPVNGVKVETSSTLNTTHRF